MDFLYHNIPGNTVLKSELTQLVKSGRFPHTSLFLGPAGSAKLALALATARLLQCKEPLGNDACGQCASCKKAEKMIHPDIHYTFPTIGANTVSDEFIDLWRKSIPENPYLSMYDWTVVLDAPSKQPKINKDNCNKLLKKLSLKSFEMGNKIMILWLPEFMFNEGNRLLKLFEEPPENTYILLIAEQIDHILPTIISRCQIFQVKPFTQEEISIALTGEGLDNETARQISITVEGNMNEALNFMQHNDTGHNKRFIDWLRISYEGNAVKLTKFVDDFSKLKIEQQKYFFNTAMVMMRQILRAHLKSPVTSLLDEGEIEFVEKFSASNSMEKIEKMIDLLNDAIFYLERNANVKILMMSRSLKLNGLLRAK